MAQERSGRRARCTAEQGGPKRGRLRALIVIRILVVAGIFLGAPLVARPEAEPPSVDRVVIEGNARVDEEAIRVHLHSTAGSPFDRATVTRDIRTVYEMGFFEQVEADWREVEGQRVLVFRVVERPLIRSVQIEGAKEVKAEEIEAALKIRPQTILDPTRMREGLAAAKKLYEEEGYLDAVIEQRTVDLGGNEAELIYTVDEKKRIRVRKILFEGNRTFSDRKLRKVMATKQKWLLSRFTGAGLLKKDVLKTDMERLAAFYYEHGYITVRVDEPLVERRRNGLYVTMKIDEGEQYRVGELSVSGTDQQVGDAKALLARLDLEPGEVFSAGTLRRDVETVTDVFADEGYAFASVEPVTRIRATERLVDIEFMVNKGAQAYIDRIEVKGNVKTRDKVVRRELELQEQELFSGTKLRRSRAAIQRLGFFKSVDVKTTRGSAADRLDVSVEVTEGQTGSFSAGAGFSSADRLLFNVRISEINLFGRGQQLVLNGDLGSLRRNIILSFTEPYLLDTRLTFGVDAFSWRLIYEDFTREGTGFGTRVLYPLTALGLHEVAGLPLTDVRAGLSYRLEQAEITELDENASRSVRLEEGQKLVSSITPQLRRNTLNHAIDPTGGSMQDLSMQLAGLGGDSNFLKLEARSRWYYSFWESPTFGTFTYSIRGEIGWGFGEEGVSGEELPLFERYFPGGLSSVRGFKVRTLGPREKRRNAFGKVVEETEIGGSRQIVLGNEIIFPILKGFGVKGVLFFDAGEAFTATEGIQLGDLRYAVGGGIRWLSPFGPLHMGIGFPLNPREDDDRSVLLFSFGGPVM